VEAVAPDDFVDSADELPPREEFLRTIGAIDPKASPLLRILLAKLRPEAPLAEQLTAIEQLGRFVIAGPGVPGAAVHETLARFEMLVVALERIPAAQRRFQATLRSVFAQTRGLKLFGEVGLPNDRGLLAETTDRLARRFLPEAPAPLELVALAGHMIRKLDDLAWLGPAADPLLHRLADAGGDCWDPLRLTILEAISMVTTRIAAIGMSEAFRSRGVVTSVRETPLYQLTRTKPADMPPLIEKARRHLDSIRLALEETGVSVGVVYSLDSIERGLARIEILLPFVDGSDQVEPTYEIRAVIASIGRGLVGGRSFTQLLSDNLRLLARKVIERAGRTGEHYVTSSRREYFKMLASAAGGGVFTCGTAVAKYWVKWGEFSPFLDGLFSSVVYAGSFIVMQLLGFTLATKQPSMTAAALAGTIRSGPGRLDELVPLIARIARSQFAAAMGNVSAVIVTTLLFDFLYTQATGHPFLDAAASVKTVESFHPWGSGTVFYAALTGVLLWVSSLFAGWFENWIVYRRLPEAIEHHRWGKRLGRERMARWARFLEHHAAGFGGSIALGTLLAMVPAIGNKFFGLPLDVRHITLSTGSLTFSVSSVGLDGIGTGPFVAACFGIAIIGMLNFGVSFALALVVALRARDVPRGERRTLPAAVVRRFFKHPFEFFYPPRNS
jgi:site-specific recombinase